jgi:hypothetical protein
MIRRKFLKSIGVFTAAAYAGPELIGIDLSLKATETNVAPATESKQNAVTKLGPDDGPNQPIGIPRGINPGMVVWVWNPDATNEKCNSVFDTQDWYWKPENVNEKVVGEMIRSALTKLTGKRSVSQAWDLLFHAQNLRKSNTNKGYTKGEKIFIKINQGTSRWLLTDEDKKKGYYYPSTLEPNESQRRTSMGVTETTPYTVLEILRELVNEIGVNQSDIMVGDPMTNIYAYNYDVWVKEFPQVAYLDKYSTNFGRTMIYPSAKELVFYANGTPAEKLFDVHEKADYLINIANFKPHLSAGISLSAKNHFGSIASPTAQHLHASLIVTRGRTPNNSGYGKYRVLVDLSGSKYLGQNTVLFMVDGLFGGGSSEISPPVKYLMPPFNNDWSSSIFVSMDQIALESVCYDFLRTEWNGQRTHNPVNASNEGNPSWHGVDDYLHQAANPASWPEGIIYDPDKSGIPLTTLGVHEHWNNPIDKQYSRNLGTGNGIELVSIPDSLVKNIRRE